MTTPKAPRKPKAKPSTEAVEAKRKAVEKSFERGFSTAKRAKLEKTLQAWGDMMGVDPSGGAARGSLASCVRFAQQAGISRNVFLRVAAEEWDMSAGGLQSLMDSFRNSPEGKV